MPCVPDHMIVCLVKKRYKRGVENLNDIEVYYARFKSQADARKHIRAYGYNPILFVSKKLITQIGDCKSKEEIYNIILTRMSANNRGAVERMTEELTEYIWENFLFILDLLVD